MKFFVGVTNNEWFEPLAAREYRSSRDSYALHGRPLAVIASAAEERPSQLFLDWHRGTLFRG